MQIGEVLPTGTSYTMLYVCRLFDVSNMLSVYPSQYNILLESDHEIINTIINNKQITSKRSQRHFHVGRFHRYKAPRAQIYQFTGRQAGGLVILRA